MSCRHDGCTGMQIAHHVVFACSYVQHCGDMRSIWCITLFMSFPVIVTRLTTVRGAERRKPLMSEPRLKIQPVRYGYALPRTE